MQRDKSARMNFILSAALHRDNNASIFLCVCVTAATGLPSCSPQVFRDPSEGFSGTTFQRAWQLQRELAQSCYSPWHWPVPGWKLAAAELCHTLQRGHQQWELILTHQNIHRNTDKYGHRNRTHTHTQYIERKQIGQIHIPYKQTRLQRFHWTCVLKSGY